MSSQPADAGIMNRLVSLSIRRHIPLNVHFDITYRCNERCIHCYLDHDDHGEMTTDEIKRVLDELKAVGTLFMTFSGGEIFVRNDCFRILEYAHKLHFDISIKTNGLGTDAERARRLREIGVRRVQLSVYSADAAVHDEITKVKGSFVRTMEAVKRFRDAGLVTKIACPIMPHNSGGYRELVNMAADLGVPYVIDMTITGKLDGDMSLLALRQSSDDLKGMLSDPLFKPNDCDESSMEIAEGLVETYHDIPCSAGHNSVYISPYGDVWPCVQMPIPAGNLRQKSFSEIWFGSPELKRVREVQDTLVPICSSCDLRRYCERCPGLALTEQGDYNGPSARACELAETKARIAGIENPVSAYHKMQQEQGFSAGKSVTPRTQLVTISQIIA